MENERKAGDGEKSSVTRYPLTIKNPCPACGAEVSRNSARFCNVCGKLLAEEYQPLDNWRSSYNLQGRSFGFENRGEESDKNLFERNENGTAQAAWACLVYSFVPYLGILFVPFTFSISIYGYFVSLRRPQTGGGKMALTSFYLSFVVLAMQIFLWWLLYFVPTINR